MLVLDLYWKEDLLWFGASTAQIATFKEELRKATLGCQRKRGAFLFQHTLEGGTPNKHILGAWWKACVVSGV